MNNIKVMIFKLLRTYVTKSKCESVGIHKKLKISKMNKEFDDNFEEMDQEDSEIYDSDFMTIDTSYKNKIREDKRIQEQLKRRIVKSKVFKEIEPNFLTYVEKDQIKKLHENNPKEWTPEKLSESFPALPETIKKILKIKWIPKSVERILQYDNKVIENWKQLKTGKLVVNDTLKQHLMKFKDRKIHLCDKETLMNFIPPKIELPKPKSSFFSNIIKNSTDKESIIENKLLISSQNNINKDKKNFNVTEKKDIKFKETNDSMNICETRKYNTKEKTLLFEEFIKNKLNNPSEISHEEKIALMNIYKKYVESKNSEDVSFNVMNNIKKDAIIEKKDISTTKTLSDKNSILNIKTDEFKVATKLNNDISLDTYIKERNSFMETNVEYFKRIKIPQNVYKQGMTYRIKDCYYDDDGEFLYRIPGLKVN
ncbi:RING finger protein PFF0165c [Apis mellifera]|uniref:RING finger protein PFF0165c n=1 Tax=Apis mellifera TaxID=7460 RepID=A0A7M7H1M3_APIME|nr:RING finger protein PFF0165c [Apis mellifera]|eukprot:XP_006566766.1 RING finger protein PFF0165c [Apis mellifera]